MTDDTSLLDRVTLVLRRVSEQRRSLSGASTQETRDLDAALEAVQLIHEEIRSGQVRSIKSAGFTRYVIDEESNMKMDADLKAEIVAIEFAYKKY